MATELEKSKDINLPDQKQNQEWKNPVIVAALITAIAGVLVALIPALLGFPPIIAIFASNPTLTPTTTINTAPNEPIVFPSETPKQNVILLTATETSLATIETRPAATSGLPTGMDVQLITDRTSGKAPLTVKFDARGSFLRAPDGTIYRCQSGPCNYTWFVYKGNDQLNVPKRSSDGTFIYTFSRRGDYRVAVKVCRGQGESDCAFDAEEITATK